MEVWTLDETASCWLVDGVGRGCGCVGAGKGATGYVDGEKMRRRMRGGRTVVNAVKAASGEGEVR